METQIKTLQDARDEGHQAAKEGKMLNENPYPRITEHYDAWRKAWNNAEKAGSTPEQSPGSGTAGGYVEAEEAKSIVSDVVSDALVGYNDKYHTEDGCVQWAKVERVIHAKIDEAVST